MIDLSNANLSDAHMRGEDLSGVTLNNANLTRIDLSKADLSNIKLKNAYLYEANLKGADLKHANLRGAYLACADLTGADLTEADLTDADLGQANLTNADLSRAHLGHAHLDEAILINTNLTSAYLYKADLTGTDLSSADFSDACFNSANLADTKLPKGEEIRKGIILKENLLGFKKGRNGEIIELLIPKGNIVFSIHNYVCRTNSAKVIKITNKNGKAVKTANSLYDNKFTYTVGKKVEVENFDLAYNVQCSNGIHFFRTRKEAEEYEPRFTSYKK